MKVKSRLDAVMENDMRSFTLINYVVYVAIGQHTVPKQ